MKEPTVIKSFPGQAVDEWLKVRGRLPSEEICPNHPDSPNLPYMADCADADRRLKRREQQWMCGRCGKWIWAEYMVDLTGALSEGWWKRHMKEIEKNEKRQSGDKDE